MLILSVSKPRKIQDFSYLKAYRKALREFKKVGPGKSDNIFGFGGDKLKTASKGNIFIGVHFRGLDEPYFSQAKLVAAYELKIGEKKWNVILTHQLFYYAYIVEGSFKFYDGTKYNINLKSPAIGSLNHDVLDVGYRPAIEKSHLTKKLIEMVGSDKIWKNKPTKTDYTCKENVELKVLSNSYLKNFKDKCFVDIDASTSDRFKELYDAKVLK